MPSLLGTCPQGGPVLCGPNPTPLYLLLHTSRGRSKTPRPICKERRPAFCLHSQHRGPGPTAAPELPPASQHLPLEPAPNSLISDHDAQENRQVLGEGCRDNTCKANGLYAIRIPVPARALLGCTNVTQTRACTLRWPHSRALQEIVLILSQAFSSFPGAEGTHSWPYPSPRP